MLTSSLTTVAEQEGLRVEALRQLRVKLAREGPRLEGGGGVPAVQQALQAADVSGGGVRRGAWPRVTLACLPACGPCPMP